MRRLIASLLLASFAMVLVAAQGDVKRRIQENYDRADAFLLKKDVRGMARWMGDTRTPDYVFLAKGRRHRLQELIREMYTIVPAFDKVTKASVHIDSFKSTATTALATITTELELVTKAQADHKVHVIAQQSVGEDSWIKINGVWKLRQSKLLKEQFYKDGKLAGA